MSLHQALARTTKNVWRTGFTRLEVCSFSRRGKIVLEKRQVVCEANEFEVAGQTSDFGKNWRGKKLEFILSPCQLQAIELGDIWRVGRESELEIQLE